MARRVTDHAGALVDYFYIVINVLNRIDTLSLQNQNRCGSSRSAKNNALQHNNWKKRDANLTITLEIGFWRPYCGENSRFIREINSLRIPLGE